MHQILAQTQPIRVLELETWLDTAFHLAVWRKIWRNGRNLITFLCKDHLFCSVHDITMSALQAFNMNYIEAYLSISLYGGKLLTSQTQLCSDFRNVDYLQTAFICSQSHKIPRVFVPLGRSTLILLNAQCLLFYRSQFAPTILTLCEGYVL